jgi:isopentenyl-diphosphate delta-isomerase
MLADPSAAESFMLRRYAPDILLFGNLGAVQLNNGITADDCRKLVQLTEIDALYLHLNPLQEAVQPEGDTNFENITERIREVVQALEVPVLVKEGGAGIGAEDAKLLLDAGVKYIDVAGSGGTSWSRIESHRAADGRSTGIAFQDWGLPTPEALRRLQPICRDRATLIASGGIRSGIDMVKSMLLGASLCGIARPFIEYAEDSPEAVIQYINSLKKEFKTAMFLLGIKDVASIINAEYGFMYE